jgi:hypothetical protein
LREEIWERKSEDAAAAFKRRREGREGARQGGRYRRGSRREEGGIARFSPGWFCRQIKKPNGRKPVGRDEDDQRIDGVRGGPKD